MFPLEMLPWELVKDREITHPEQALPTEGFWVEDLSYTNRNSELEYHIEHCVEKYQLAIMFMIIEHKPVLNKTDAKRCKRCTKSKAVPVILLCSEWVPSEWEFKQVMKTLQ